MRFPSTFAIIAGFPSSLLLIYLAVHVTEGWQLLIIGVFVGCFVAAWLKHSTVILVTSYAVTIALTAWVGWANLEMATVMRRRIRPALFGLT